MEGRSGAPHRNRWSTRFSLSPPLFPSLLKGKRKNRRTQQVRCLETMRLPEGGPIWVVAAVGIDAHNNIRFIVFFFFSYLSPVTSHTYYVTIDSSTLRSTCASNTPRNSTIRLILLRVGIGGSYPSSALKGEGETITL